MPSRFVKPKSKLLLIHKDKNEEKSEIKLNNNIYIRGAARIYLSELFRAQKIRALYLDNEGHGTTKIFSEFCDSNMTFLAENKPETHIHHIKSGLNSFFGPIGDFIRANTKIVRPDLVYLDYMCTFSGSPDSTYPGHDIYNLLKLSNKRLVLALTFSLRARDPSWFKRGNQAMRIFDIIDRGICPASFYKVISAKYRIYSVTSPMLFMILVLDKTAIYHKPIFHVLKSQNRFVGFPPDWKP